MPPLADLPMPKEEKSDEISTSFTFWDVFFWRDAPDWYRKTFLSAGFGFCYCVLKQVLNRHELEVFMPPRAKILPASMQEGYRNSQMLKYGFLKVGKEVTTIAGAAGIYYSGAYYLGRYRGVHSYENFAASGALAGVCVSLWMIRPFRARTTAFGFLLGAVLGGGGAYPTQYFKQPFWDESHDFAGYFLGSLIDVRKKAVEADVSAEAGSSSSSPPSDLAMAGPQVASSSSTAAQLTGIQAGVTVSAPSTNSSSTAVAHAMHGGSVSAANANSKDSINKSWWRPW